mmetsp:Transcript_137715/g.243326  ORF Transcript_137715/g.243326 Transcript_137715/m.243326 type:complete len:256 (+) Transcript_137715:80-847(+)
MNFVGRMLASPFRPVDISCGAGEQCISQKYCEKGTTWNPSTKTCDLTSAVSNRQQLDLTPVAHALQQPSQIDWANGTPTPSTSPAPKFRVSQEQFGQIMSHVAATACSADDVLEFKVGDLVPQESGCHHQACSIRLSPQLLAHHMDCAFIVKWKDCRWGVHFAGHFPFQGDGGWHDVEIGGNRFQQQGPQLTPEQIQDRFKNLISERTGIHASRIGGVGFPNGGRGTGIANYHTGCRHRILWWDGYWFNFFYVVG